MERLGTLAGSSASATPGSWVAQSEALARPALRPRPRQAPRFRTEAPPFGIPLTPPSALAPSQGFPGPDSLVRYFTHSFIHSFIQPSIHSFPLPSSFHLLIPCILSFLHFLFLHSFFSFIHLFFSFLMLPRIFF